MGFSIYRLLGTVVGIIFVDVQPPGKSWYVPSSEPIKKDCSGDLKREHGRNIRILVGISPLFFSPTIYILGVPPVLASFP